MTRDELRAALFDEYKANDREIERLSAKARAMAADLREIESIGRVLGRYREAIQRVIEGLGQGGERP